MGLGAAGRWIVGDATKGIAFYLIAFLGLVLAAREWGWVSFRLPERKRQTEKFWAHDFGFVMASAMWGLHIGLGFATRVTYGGFWVLVTVALALGDPLYGAVLMLVYWLGRVLPVWAGPALSRSDSEAVDLSESAWEHRPVYNRIVGVTLIWSVVITVLLALRTHVP
jgi:cytochrome c biogenesis protein CcdA